MKKIITKIFLILFVAIIAPMTSCNDELDYELFTKNVYLTTNGWEELRVKIQEGTNTVTIPLSVSINGTTGNDQEVKVSLKYDMDTLDKYNFEKYREQPELYYTALPENVYSFGEDHLVIKSGEIKAITYLTIDLNKVDDKYADYVLPLSIESTSGYSIAKSAYSKVLYHLNLENSFSGNYSGTIDIFKTKSNGDNDKDSKLSINNKSFYAISDRVCYFYAGQFDRSSAVRDDFIITINLDDDNLVTLHSPNTELDVKLESYTYKVDIEPNLNDKRYETHNISINLKYTYKDLTDLDKPIMRAEGTVATVKQILKENTVN
ncbi:BT_3987 domain-containing protein [Dysgonomonas sp. Marseille-P4361]|uniref:BT_3987 domain-containing protein n=1 Tax=Dysgonomonas sp. Marseille-P4361 TaxID=2161820 RepID=UPI000D54F4A1|nr:DUF1735 domain-containing protein [Dysgonomonas sp. Marseille-P4361]